MSENKNELVTISMKLPPACMDQIRKILSFKGLHDLSTEV
jgi:hypothetical protein